jgi:hypothetical protein
VPPSKIPSTSKTLNNSTYSKENSMNITDIEIEEESTELTVQQKIDDVIARMEEITITSQDELQEAAEWLTKNKQTQKFVKEYYEPERKDTYDAYTAVTGEIKKFNDILIKAEKTVKKKMSDYQMEQDRIRREELDFRDRRQSEDPP